MKWFCVLFLLLCSSVHAEGDFPLLDELVGNWEGKWDDKYGVKFVITQTELEFDVKYFIEEVIGEPYIEFDVKGKPLNKNSVMAGTLLFVVSQEIENKVTVVGIFDPGTRIAKLKKSN